MKRYPHVVSRLFNRPLLITAAKHREICLALEAHMAGTSRRAHDDNPDLDGEDGEDDEPAPAPESNWQAFGTDVIIPVHGILGKHLSDLDMISGGCDLDTIAAQIEIALEDPMVRRIIFDFRSPGGDVVGVPELGRKIAGITTKETIAFTDSQCCSGAIWLAMQCQRFYCTGSSQVGSIGVYCAVWDESVSLEKAGLRMQAISAGKYKLLGAYWKPLTDDEKSILQAGVNKTYGQFKEAVNLRREVADEFMQGQVFDGDEAVANGLADGLVEDMSEILSN